MKEVDAALLIKSLLIIALVCFFLPFLLVSCGESNVASLSGVDLMTGTTIGEYEVPCIPTVLIAALLLAISFLLSFGRRKWMRVSSMLAPGVSSVLLMFTRVFVQPQMTQSLEQEQMQEALLMLTIKWEWGFYVAVAICLLAMLAQLMLLVYPPKQDSPPRHA